MADQGSHRPTRPLGSSAASPIRPNDGTRPNVSAKFSRHGACPGHHHGRVPAVDYPAVVPAAPRPVRAAGLLVLLQGLTSVAAAGVTLAVAGGSLAGVTAVWLAGFGAILLAVGVNLVRGRHGARTPAIVAQLLLLGVCLYAIGPSSQPAYGIPAAVFCVAVLALLFCAPALRWATGDHPDGS